MEASILGLCYHIREALLVLRRRESVKVLYRGRLIATLVPEENEAKEKVSVRSHLCFANQRARARGARDESVATTSASVIVDTDSLIWLQRGDMHVAEAVASNRLFVGS